MGKRAKYEKKKMLLLMMKEGSKTNANTLSSPRTRQTTNKNDFYAPYIRENDTDVQSTPQKQHTNQRNVDLTYLPSVRSDGSASMTLSNSSTENARYRMNE